MKKNTMIAVAAIVVVAILLFSTSLKTWLPSTSGSTGQMMIQFVITDTSGQNHTYPAGFPALNLLPLTITYNGQPISKISINVFGQLSGGNVGAWSASTSQNFEIYRSGQSTPVVGSTAAYPTTGLAWNSGETKTLAQTSIPATDIDPVLQGINPSTTPITYNIHVTAASTLTIGTQTYTATASGDCNIQYVYGSVTPQLTFSISVETQPFILGQTAPN